MPNDLQFKVANAVHQTIRRLTGRRAGDSLFGMPVVMLTVRGRKSGTPRTVALTAPIRDGDSVILVASKGGAPDHPDWYKNLCVNPDVEPEMGGQTRTMRARTTTGDERAALWSRIVEAYKGYADYERRTEREIPVVVLEPR